MRSEFQDVFKDAYDHWIDDACSHRYNASKSLALQVWQHQQSKVDELQKRVDAVKQLIQEYRDPPTEDKTFCHALSIVAYELEQALKGGEDANQ